MLNVLNFEEIGFFYTVGRGDEREIGHFRSDLPVGQKVEPGGARKMRL